MRLYGEVLHEYPRDLIALQTAHVGDFLLGQSQMLRDRVAQVLPHWNQDLPGYSYVLGMFAFGLEETNLYDTAEETGRRALELEPRDPWSVHAVTHVMEMQGRSAEGIAWLNSRSGDWAPGNGFAYHNWWHLALLPPRSGRERSGRSRSTTSLLRPQPTQVAYENIDASALLWRLTLRGVDVGDALAAAGRGLGPRGRGRLLRLQRRARADGLPRRRPRRSGRPRAGHPDQPGPRRPARAATA